MAFSLALLWSALLVCRVAQSSFPENFMFGVSTSAYQIEGAWNEDGKSESICDRYVHTSNQIVDNSTGDVGARSYFLWERDISLAKDLGVKFYRFSISWSRILPTGFNNKINKAGVDYYNTIIDAMVEAGIEPMVTIYHSDLPQRLQDLGGWTNPNIVSWYSDYARVVFSIFADRVKYWVTMNEPVIVCEYGYGSQDSMPGINEKLVAPYLCNKYILMSHAAAYRIYDTEYRNKYHGTADYFAVNYYGSAQIRVSEISNWQTNHVTEAIPGSFDTYFNGYYVYPPGIRNAISWINERYGKLDIWITENGFPTESRNIRDNNRTTSLIEHLQEVLLSIEEDKNTVLAYTYWSLIDNFEWNYGYTIKFGLHDIDFTVFERPSTKRESAYTYECIIRNRGIDECLNN